MIIDNHSMVVVSSITYDPSRPPASGCVFECLPATACGPTAPVSHRLNFTPYISFLYIPLCLQVLYYGDGTHSGDCLLSVDIGGLVENVQFDIW